MFTRNMNTDTKTDWQKRECGALWKKESPTQKFYSGHVKVDNNGEEKLMKVMVFSNRHKSKESHPDFRIYTVDEAPTGDTVDDNAVLGDEVATEEVL